MIVCRHDLAALLLRLRQFDKAEKILKQALSQEENGEIVTFITVS